MPKLRPYRVDYFDVEEMKDNDFALVQSVIVRAVTAASAATTVLAEDDFVRNGYRKGRIIIRAYRYYKNLVHKNDVYKAVEDLFTANKAIKVMEAVEAYRDRVKTKTTSGEHVTRTSDSSLYDEVCVNCGATDASGKLDQPCPSVPTSGPESPATKAVVADMQGMLAHDAHEQTMDTFVPASVPEGKRFPDPTNKLPVTAEEPGRAPTSWSFGLGEPAIEPDQAVDEAGRPAYLNPPPSPQNVGEPFGGSTPLGVKVLIFGFALLVVIGIVHFFLTH